MFHLKESTAGLSVILVVWLYATFYVQRSLVSTLRSLRIPAAEGTWGGVRPLGLAWCSGPGPAPLGTPPGPQPPPARGPLSAAGPTQGKGPGPGSELKRPKRSL